MQDEKLEKLKEKINLLKNMLENVNSELDGMENKSDKITGKFKNIQETVTDTKQVMDEFDDKMERMGNEVRRHFTDHFSKIIDGDFSKFKERLSRSITVLSKQMENDMLKTFFLGGVNSRNTQIGGLIGSALPNNFKAFMNSGLNDSSNLFMQTLSKFWGNKMFETRAIGGMVNSKTPYLVGENGPEMFVPDNAGKIIPNKALGNNKAINVVMNINTPNADSFKKSSSQITSEMISALSRANRF